MKPIIQCRNQIKFSRMFYHPRKIQIILIKNKFHQINSSLFIVIILSSIQLKIKIVCCKNNKNLNLMINKNRIKWEVHWINSHNNRINNKINLNQNIINNNIKNNL